MKMISACFLWGNVLLRGELKTNAINSNFENFKRAHHMKSVRVPLISLFLANLPSQYFSVSVTNLWVGLCQATEIPYPVHISIVMYLLTK